MDPVILILILILFTSVTINLVLTCRLLRSELTLRRKSKRLEAVMKENERYFYEQFDKYVDNKSNEDFH